MKHLLLSLALLISVGLYSQGYPAKDCNHPEVPGYMEVGTTILAKDIREFRITNQPEKCYMVMRSGRQYRLVSRAQILAISQLAYQFSGVPHYQITFIYLQRCQN